MPTFSLVASAWKSTSRWSTRPSSEVRIASTSGKAGRPAADAADHVADEEDRRGGRHDRYLDRRASMTDEPTELVESEDRPLPPGVAPVVVPRWVQLVTLPLAIVAIWIIAKAAGVVLL